MTKNGKTLVCEVRGNVPHLSLVNKEVEDSSCAPVVSSQSKQLASSSGGSQGNPGSAIPDSAKGKNDSSQDCGEGKHVQNQSPQPASQDSQKKVRFNEVVEEKALMDNMKKWKALRDAGQDSPEIRVPGGDSSSSKPKDKVQLLVVRSSLHHLSPASMRHTQGLGRSPEVKYAPHRSQQEPSKSSCLHRELEVSCRS